MNGAEAEDPWWRTFFEGPYSEHQIDGLLSAEAVGDTDWIIHALGINCGDHVLDAPTGAGRIALELARRGCAVTGVDFNRTVVDHGRSVAEREGLVVEWVCDDLRQFRRPRAFDHAICYFGSIGYSSEEADLTFCENVAQSLKPGGRFLLDTHTTESFLPILDKQKWNWKHARAQGAVTLDDCQFILETSRIQATWAFAEGDGRQRSSFVSSIRLYSYRELCNMLRQVGFQKFTGLETNTGQPFRVGASRLGLVAEM